MQDENESEHPPTDPQDQPLPDAPMIPATPQQNKRRSSSDAASDKENGKAIKLEQEIRNGERWLIGISAVAVILNAVIALIYYGQLNEMRKATRASEKAAKAAASAADTADKTLKEIRAGGTDTHELAVQAKEQAKAANDSAKTAARSLKTITDQFRLDQRPYIAIKGFSITDYVTAKPTSPTVGQPIVASVTFNNVGKSQALNTLIHCHVLFGTEVSKYKIERPDGNRLGITVGQSQDSAFATAVSIKDTYTRENVALDPSAVVNWDGSMPIILFGRVSYKDIYGTSYCLPYSVSYIPSGSSGTWGENGVVNGVPTPKLCPEGQR